MVLCDLNSVGKNQDLVEKQQQQHKWLVNWKEWQNSNDHFIGDIAKLYFIQYVICTTPDLLLLLKLLLKSIYSSLPISGLLSLAFCGLSTRKSFVNRHRLCVCVCVFMLACMGMCGRVRGWGVLSNVHSNSRPCFPAPFLQTLPLVLPLKGHSWSLDICLQKSPIWVSQSAPSVKFAKGLSTKTVEATQC